MSSQKRNLVRLVIASLAIGVVPATGCHVSKTPYAEAHSPRDLDTLIDDGKLTDEHVLKYSLQECIAQALSSSTIMRDLGVSVLRYPGLSGANADPALTFTDPRFGEEAALSAFDANAFASSMYDKNDRKFNNQFYGQGGFLQQDLSNTQFGVSKRSATGGLFSLRNISIYDRNNQVTNSFLPYSWENYVEAQIRQPLLQGAGSQYNMIAGPNAIPGQLNGVLLARVRTDIALVDFERSVRDYVAEVENAYWDLYYAYRDLEARIMVRDIAAEYANSIGLREVQKADRAQATEQVIRFQADIVESLNGRPIDGTRTYNGTTGGAFRGNGGVRVCERKLRLLMGLPINDGKLVRPIDKPTVAKVDYDYQFLVQEALNGREELRRQRWVIKQRELELIGHRNFLKPQLDLVNTFRLRGMGGSKNKPGFGQLTGPDSAVSSMFNGDFPEWQVGIEYLAPVGFRRGNSAVRYSQLALAKEVDILREQERGVHLGISNAVNETKRAYELVDLQKQRREQIETQLDALQKKLNEEQSETALDVVLETQRRLLDATIRYHQAEIEYVLSIRNVNLEKGSLLQYCNVYINEAATSQDAISDAVQRVAMQSSSATHNAQHSVIGKPIAK